MKRSIVIFAAVLVVLMSLVSCFAEASVSKELIQGMYIVGQDVESGSYTMYLKPDPENSKTPNGGIGMFLSVEDYLWVKDEKPKYVASVSVRKDERAHITLIDGMVLNVIYFNAEFICLEKDE